MIRDSCLLFGPPCSRIYCFVFGQRCSVNSC